jgi:hypothetical protein
MLHFVDDAGKHATIKFNIPNTSVDPSSGSPASISADAQALSDSALYETEILIVGVNNSPGSPGTGPYDRPADKAALVLNAADSSKVHLQIGGPKAEMFPNAYNVDPTVTDVAALITALKTNATSAEGAAITSFAYGYRRRPPRRKGQ